MVDLLPCVIKYLSGTRYRSSCCEAVVVRSLGRNSENIMAFPLKIVAVLSAVAAYITSITTRSQWSLHAFTTYYVVSFVLSFFLHAFWDVILYPKLFSPLRSLPGPRNPSWYNGQWQKITELPFGIPMQQWYGLFAQVSVLINRYADNIAG